MMYITYQLKDVVDAIFIVSLLTHVIILSLFILSVITSNEGPTKRTIASILKLNTLIILVSALLAVIIPKQLESNHESNHHSRQYP